MPSGMGRFCIVYRFSTKSSRNLDNKHLTYIVPHLTLVMKNLLII